MINIEQGCRGLKKWGGGRLTRNLDKHNNYYGYSYVKLCKKSRGGALSTLPGSDAYDELFVTFFVQVCIKWPCSGSDITSDWRALSICDFEDQGNTTTEPCVYLEKATGAVYFAYYTCMAGYDFKNVFKVNCLISNIYFASNNEHFQNIKQHYKYFFYPYYMILLLDILNIL